jgi:hypothetical protein
VPVQLLPLDGDTRQLITLYDNVICVIFLVDFGMNLAGSRPRRAYLVGQRGWLDLLGSIPSVGVFQLGALFRLARLSRLARITRLLRGQSPVQGGRDHTSHRLIAFDMPWHGKSLPPEGFETQEYLMTLIVQACAAHHEVTAVDISLRKHPVLGPTGSLGVRLILTAEDLAALRRAA